jgi:hypothetical protein
VVADPAEQTASGILAGYHPPMCSKTGDAIDRIAAAIDQLASDAHGAASERELTERVAGLWQMVSDLDPELARRAQGYTATQGYTGPADGGPSA